VHSNDLRARLQQVAGDLVDYLVISPFVPAHVDDIMSLDVPLKSYR
jgi:hypothetical protein